ncbi:MAG: hypothetical protein U1F52_13140 [Burkholderiales bacterium]
MVEVNDLERAAALAGVATVDLGGAGAGHQLEASINGAGRPATHSAGSDASDGAMPPRRDVWRELLFREIRIEI